MAASLDSNPAGATGRYPLLQDDIRDADAALAEAYQDADDQAGLYQRRFHRAELTIIWGGVIAVALGAVGGITGAVSVSVVESLVTACLGALAFVVGALKWQQRWLTSRWQAEALRGERFLFIGRLGPYAGDVDRRQASRVRIIEIENEAGGGQSDE